MAYDTELADRIRELLSQEADVGERAMFGGLAFMVRGHMTAVASGQGGLMVRADPTATPKVVAETSATRAVMRGKEMDGWLRLPSADVATDTELQRWIQQAVAYVATLPSRR